MFTCCSYTNKFDFGRLHQLNKNFSRTGDSISIGPKPFTLNPRKPQIRIINFFSLFLFPKHFVELLVKEDVFRVGFIRIFLPLRLVGFVHLTIYCILPCYSVSPWNKKWKILWGLHQEMDLHTKTWPVGSFLELSMVNQQCGGYCGGVLFSITSSSPPSNPTIFFRRISHRNVHRPLWRVGAV